MTFNQKLREELIKEFETYDSFCTDNDEERGLLAGIAVDTAVRVLVSMDEPTIVFESDMEVH